MFRLWKEHRIKKEFRKLRKHLVSWRHNDDDILSSAQKSAFDTLLADAAAVSCGTPADMAEFCKSSGERMARIIPPGRFRALREWLDILAVAMAVAFGIRGLFFQPFKIPTSSMQPTLYGIHYMAKDGHSNPLLGKIPLLDRLLFSARRAELTVQADGQLVPDSAYMSGNIFSDAVTFRIGSMEYTLPGAPDKIADYAQLDPYRTYKKGEKLCNGWLSTGDHLFVDRLSHNLFGLKRGDVIVFNTENIAMPDGRKLTDVSGYYYIKRLAGLPGDVLKIEKNQLLIRPKGEKEFVPVQKLDNRFERIYSMQGGYQGHTAMPGGMSGGEGQETVVPADCYFALGDNTRYSADSRFWGFVPRRNITGKAMLIFYPFSRRWGIADKKEALPVPTGEPAGNTFPSMGLQ